MMKVTSRYWDGIQYRVSIQDNEPDLNIISVRFDTDLSALSEVELIDQVMEQFYRERYEGKFMSEAVDTVEQVKKEMLSLVEKYKAMVADGESTVNKIKQDSEVTQGSVIEATEMLFDHEMRLTTLEGDTHEETNTEIEGGE
ncbi:hypothetical protein [Globicatella sp. PHS-GS-PNBC-21-1553]|uniref:hypothetical protein n=1 Tax=Globicatella sp. PHS-GS-PNBC-21-1553 TaxID=2885764 RepID=UPI00298EF54D|nr:hypothetical protein [Globicatella sp. PHS-GS-PNBC-21-1553]WPC08018.1 hypothetical protein LB888_08160 [Globicatella sp. PHS-GS-PNBC-21-1553]